jgi:SAM-dependent methyltransferase
MEELNYGNWIRRKILVILGSSAIVAGGLSFVPLGEVYRIVILVLFIILLVSFLFPLYSYIMFSQKGGKVQQKVYNLIILKLGEQAKGSEILDIGSGNGVLAVKLALYHPNSIITGVDYWGENWEYSKGVCEANARLAKVEEQVSFQKGDAASLDFSDGTFDGVTSNLTFHEVQSLKDKRDAIKEALRILKPGGSFSFVDYFFEAKYYGYSQEFEEYLRNSGLSTFELHPLNEILDLPILLRHPKILGRVGILYGKK